MSAKSKNSNKLNRQDLEAGIFSVWLTDFCEAQRKDTGMEVSCGDCNACCKSSYFIHVRPDEKTTLSRIPCELLFPAPGLPKGNVLMGYDEHGCCPMLIDEKCSIYKARPLTCRNYDCRVFTATGLLAGEADKLKINQRIQQWQFKYPAKIDHDRQAALKAAALFLRERAGSFPDGFVPNNTSHLAVMAIKVYDVFLKYIDEPGDTGNFPPDSTIIEEVMEVLEKFGTGNV